MTIMKMAKAANMRIGSSLATVLPVRERVAADSSLTR
jgi:hypothetical protein